MVGMQMRTANGKQTISIQSFWAYSAVTPSNNRFYVVYKQADIHKYMLVSKHKSVCIYSFSHCCDQIPDKSLWIVYVDLQFYTVLFIMMRKSCSLEFGGTDHIESHVGIRLSLCESVYTHASTSVWRSEDKRVAPHFLSCSLLKMPC